MGFNGVPRSGKTAAVALMGLTYWKKGYTILSNFPFYDPATGRPNPLPERYKLITPEDLLKMLRVAVDYEGFKPLWPNHLLCGQELQSWIESRMGQDKGVLMLGYCFLYLGKMGISLVYDTQLNSAVDKRLKENVSYRFESENLPDRFRYWELDITKTEENVRTGRKVDVSKQYMQERVFPYYNTYKLTKPLGFDRWMQTLNL